MTSIDEFYFTKIEKLDYLGNVINTSYELNNCEGSNLTIAFSTLEELLNVPYTNPNEFIDFLSEYWDEKYVKILINEKEYTVDRETIEIVGVTL